MWAWGLDMFLALGIIQTHHQIVATCQYYFTRGVQCCHLSWLFYKRTSVTTYQNYFQCCHLSISYLRTNIATYQYHHTRETALPPINAKKLINHFILRLLLESKTQNSWKFQIKFSQHKKKLQTFISKNYYN